MDAILQFFIDWGYLGMFISAFAAGSILPFSSEAVLVACIGLGLDPALSVIAATAGNVGGEMTCFWMGHLGKREWIEKYLKVKKKDLEKAERFVKGRGAWMAFFSFIPIIGTAVVVLLGLMRSNTWIVLIAMTLGKALRYIIVVWGVLQASSLIK